jgi:hypothetical protein
MSYQCLEGDLEQNIQIAILLFLFVDSQFTAGEALEEVH